MTVNIWKSYIWTADKDVNMKAIFSLMNTTWAVVKIRPEKNSGQYGIWTHVHYCEDGFHIHGFNCSSNIWLSYIHSCLLATSRVYLEPTWWPALSWLVSSVGEALHWYHRGHGFKSWTGLNFFSGLIFTAAQVVFITVKITFFIHVVFFLQAKCLKASSHIGYSEKGFW